MVNKLLILASLSLTNAWAQAFNQKLARLDPHMDEAVNEKPLNRNFLENNSKHKVLIAIIDNGVDYNHPILSNNIHFQLNDMGEPIGAGYDFIADDAWASPYLANTLMLDKLQLEGTKLINLGAKEVFSIEALNLIEDKKHNYYSIKNIAKDAESLTRVSELANPNRDYKAEISEGAGHGTHVAGLASYDDDEIGIIPVRVNPISISLTKTIVAKSELIRTSYVEDISVYDRAYEGILYAINSGAKVINISLNAVGTLSDKITIAARNEKIKALNIKLETLLKKHPDVVVVSAAGNDKSWMEHVVVNTFPCGIKAPNVLCVGALTPSGDLVQFTNISLKKSVNMIYAAGENIYSTYPQKMCNPKSDASYNDLKSSTNIIITEKIFSKSCVHGDTPKLVKMSGTSMATPIVSRMVAKIIKANPGITGKGAIDLLMQKADSIGGEDSDDDLRIKVDRIRAKAPSWYANKSLVPSGAAVYSLGLTKAMDEFKKDNWVSLWVEKRVEKRVERSN